MEALRRHYSACVRALARTRAGAWVRAQLAASPVLRNILTLASGSVIAQAAALILNIPLARIFSPTQIGHVTLVISAAAIVVTIAAGRFDMTMMLPREDDDARQLKKLASRLIVGFSVAASLACLAARPLIAAHYGSSQLSWVFVCVGILVFLQAETAALQYWFNRKSLYRTIAINRAQQTLAVYVVQLLIGLVGFTGVWGLFIGNCLGLASAWLYLRSRSQSLRTPVGPQARTIGQLVRRYRKMPLLNGPNALVDAIRLNGINLLLGTYSAAALGQFTMAWKVLLAPVSLINGAVSQVFFQKLATVEPGEMTPLVRTVLKRASLFGAPVFAVIALISPWLFPLLFGDRWVEAGHYAQVMCPWLFVMLLSSPLSTIFVVTERQSWMLAFSLVFCLVPLAWLMFSPFELFATIAVMSTLMALMLLAVLVMGYAAAKRFDAQASSRV